MSRPRIVYLQSPFSNVRHYIWGTSDGTLMPYCKVVCWINPRLTVKKFGSRLCKDCKKARGWFTKKPLNESDFKVAGLSEFKYCFD